MSKRPTVGSKEAYQQWHHAARLPVMLILAKVLEGRSCVGKADMREPPKDAAGIRFDSTKDAHDVRCRFS